MRTIDTVYIDGQFVTPHGEELFDLFNPATEEKIGQVRLGDAIDAKAAVAAAKRAFPAYSRTSKAERIALLRRLHDAVAARTDVLAAAMIEEYGAPQSFVGFSASRAANLFLDMAQTLEAFEFTQTIGGAEVTFKPIGVVAAISPWNSNFGSICSKLATALAAGCTVVIKPSEMSAIQTQVLTEALHEAGLPPGVFNIVNGRGDVVVAELTSHPDIAKVTFTGSTAVGRSIMRAAAETMKRVTLELGGKGPNIILPDADLESAISTVIAVGFATAARPALPGPASWRRGLACRRSSIASRQRSQPSRSATPPIPRERRADGQPEAMGPGAGLYSAGSRGRRRTSGRRRRPAGGLTGDGSCSPPSSPASTTTCASRARRSSARCCASSPTTTKTMPSPSPTTPPMACRPMLRAPIWRTRVAWPSGWSPAAW